MVTRLIRIGSDWNYESKITSTSDVLTGGQFVLFTSNNNNWFKIDYGNTKLALKTISFYKKFVTIMLMVIFIVSLSSLC
jgi:hypothetical protein